MGETSQDVHARHREKKLRLRRELITEVLGDECVICGRSPELMTTHRKDGEAHPKFQIMGIARAREEIESGEYVRLCPTCHKGVHWAMEFLGFDWDEIQGRLAEPG